MEQNFKKVDFYGLKQQVTQWEKHVHYADVYCHVLRTFCSKKNKEKVDDRKTCTGRLKKGQVLDFLGSGLGAVQDLLNELRKLRT